MKTWLELDINVGEHRGVFTATGILLRDNLARIDATSEGRRNREDTSGTRGRLMDADFNPCGALAIFLSIPGIAWAEVLPREVRFIKDPEVDWLSIREAVNGFIPVKVNIFQLGLDSKVGREVLFELAAKQRAARKSAGRNLRKVGPSSARRPTKQ